MSLPNVLKATWNALNPGLLFWGVALVLFVSSFMMPSARAQEFGASFDLLSPVGGEYFEPGDTVDIGVEFVRYYDGYSGSGTMTIDLSSDNGKSWETILTSGEDFSFKDNVIKWVVPDVSCSQCLLRMVQHGGDWGFGRAVITRPISTDIVPTMWESVFTPKDSLLVINTGKTLVVVDPWNPDVPERVIEWPYALDWRRLVNIRFERGDSLVLVGVMPIAPPGVHKYDTANYGILDFYTGEPLLMFRSVMRGASPPLSASSTRGGFTLDITEDGSRILRTYEKTTDIIDVDSQEPIFELNQNNTDFRFFFGQSSQYSPDEQYFVVGAQRSIAVYNTKTFEVLWSRANVDAGQVQYSHDGRYILVTPFTEDKEYGGDFRKEENRILDAFTGDTILTAPLYWMFGVSNPAGVSVREVHGAFASRSNAYLFQNRVFPDLESADTHYFGNHGFSSMAIAPSGTLYSDFRDSLLTIRDMGIRSQPGDTTALPFSIAGALPIAVNKFMGHVKVGQTKDTVSADFLINSSSVSHTINSVVIVEGDVAEFSIISGEGPYTMGPGHTRALGIRFSPKEIGERKVVVRVTSDNGSADAVISGVGTDPTVGVEERVIAVAPGSQLSLSVHPNPADMRAIVRVSTSPAVNNARLQVVDVAGRVMADHSILLTGGERTIDINTASLASGVYRVVVKSDSGSMQSHPLVVSR